MIRLGMVIYDYLLATIARTVLGSKVFWEVIRSNILNLHPILLHQRINHEYSIHQLVAYVHRSIYYSLESLNNQMPKYQLGFYISLRSFAILLLKMTV